MDLKRDCINWKRDRAALGGEGQELCGNCMRRPNPGSFPPEGWDPKRCPTFIPPDDLGRDGGNQPRG